LPFPCLFRKPGSNLRPRDSASCATIVRLRYLTLYDDQSEFMFSTGQIGLWSIVEEGIGITAGSMPALRPLLSLSRIYGAFGSSRENSSKRSRVTTGPFPPTVGGGRDGMDAVELANRERSKVKQNVKHTRLSSEDDAQQKERESDADSQKHILKETQVTMTAEPRQDPFQDWERKRVLGWERHP
jgi:hypothetical protein